MMAQLDRFFHSLWYWLAIVCTGLALEGVALFYQYVLGEPPCVLCIQARFWVLVGMVLALVGLFLRKNRLAAVILQVGIVGALIMLINRSWISVLVERGQYDGQCGMDAGFPDWFALDVWVPQIFEVWTMCGYTPRFVFGLTMGEGLVYGSVILLLVALIGLFFQVRPWFNRRG
ncbi:disulfide bond formation protein B [Reinekea blandensis]|uniref:Disulfide bond formation protein n=1 Tax=Reinekea blandensis MED297 TaxID=314283 RepID=A4BA95_9GAMM|nr:disulfide bond formation protein B [Reinekea blandensis]EAR10851.1 disulfide bond formation protein [Reinekea sp. MED297] [Reinekea blandensis MED297]